MKLKNIGAFRVSIEKYAGKSSRVSFFLYFLYVINVICWAEQMKRSGVAHVTRNDNIARVSKGARRLHDNWRNSGLLGILIIKTYRRICLTYCIVGTFRTLILFGWKCFCLTFAMHGQVYKYGHLRIVLHDCNFIIARGKFRIQFKTKTLCLNRQYI